MLDFLSSIFSSLFTCSCSRMLAHIVNIALTLTSEMAVLIHTLMLPIREQEIRRFSGALVETHGKWSVGKSV